MSDDKYIEVATVGKDALVRIHGLGDMHLAPTFDDLTVMLVRDGYKHLAIDLAECNGMDSTFMGTLISINLRFSDEGSWMCLINVNEDNQALLKMLGVWGMVQVRESFAISPVKTAKIRPLDDDFPEKRMNIIMKAHDRLIQISKTNNELFGPFLDSLKNDLQQHRP